MGQQRVGFEIGSDAVGVVTLNRPDKLNAMDEDTFAGLHEVAAQVTQAAAEGSVRAVLLIGAGRAFSAGLDTSLFAGQASSAPSEEWIAWLQQAFTGFEDLNVPTVAAVHGVALGAGCQLALAAHLRVAAPDASFGLLEARWGLLPDLGATYRLPRLVGLGRATDLAITARTVDAGTAQAWGLVDAVLAQDGFEEQARTYAARLAAGPTVALGAVPRLMRESLSSDRGAALAAERAAQALCLASEDFSAAARAGAAREQPQFRGR